MTDACGIYLGERIVAGVVTEDTELCSSIKEADSRIIPHISIAGQEKIKWIVVLSCDIDIVIYNLRFCDLGIQEFRDKFGIKDGHIDMPIHKLEHQLDGQKCTALLKTYILTRFDVTC